MYVLDKTAEEKRTGACKYWNLKLWQAVTRYNGTISFDMPGNVRNESRNNSTRFQEI